MDLEYYLLIAPTNKKGEMEYVVSNSPTAQMKYTLNLGQNLTTGTYKIVVKLYDNDEYIGEAFDYLIIK